MSIWVNKDTKVIVQGITGKTAAYHTKEMLEYGTKIVGGTSPGKGGTEVHGVPVFNTVMEAKDKTGANASIIYVPAPFAADAIFRGHRCRIGTSCMITEHIPVNDMMILKIILKTKKLD